MNNERPFEVGDAIEHILWGIPERMGDVLEVITEETEHEIIYSYIVQWDVADVETLHKLHRIAKDPI